MAHDLKGPVGTIQGFAELLTDGRANLDEKDVAESLTAMRQCSHKMDTIINELMLLSGVRKSDGELLKRINTSLEKLQKSGAIDKILAKWGQ